MFHFLLHSLYCYFLLLFLIGAIPDGISLTKVYLSYNEYTDLYHTLRLPNNQHYGHSDFSRTSSEASGKQFSKKQQATHSVSEGKKSDESKSESETESELSLKGREKCESKQKSAEMTLAERTKARSAYFTLISEASTTEDFNQVVASTKGDIFSILLLYLHFTIFILTFIFSIIRFPFHLFNYLSLSFLNFPVKIFTFLSFYSPFFFLTPFQFFVFYLNIFF